MSYRIRPRFVLQLRASLDEAQLRIENLLKNPTCRCQGELRSRHALLFMSEKERRTWSPFVSLEFRDSKDGGNLEVHGVIGPSPNLWILFMSGYALLGFIAFVFSMLGISELIIHQSPWGFYALPPVLLLSVVWYGLSLLGQKLATDQIEILRQFLDRAFVDCIHGGDVSSEKVPLCNEESIGKIK